MALVKNIGTTLTLTANPLEKDGATTDPNAAITWSQSGPGVTLASTTGASVTGAVDGPIGTVDFTATATDPDGNSVTSAPFTVTINDPSTDTTSVVVSGS